jgi:hypothetical protein
MAKPLKLKKNDLQPYYKFEVQDSDGNAVSISGATIYCTMKNAATGTLKINRQTTGVNITDGVNGQGEYRWQAGDTDTVGKYFIEFEINPASGGKFTIPTESEDAVVRILDSLDAS